MSLTEEEMMDRTGSEKGRPRFKLFSDADDKGLDKQLNAWAEKLPAGTKVRRTQLAADGHLIYALVNYEG